MYKKCSWIRVLINNTDEQRSKACACIFQSQKRTATDYLMAFLIKLLIVKKARVYDQDFKHLSLGLTVHEFSTGIYLFIFLFINSSSLLFFIINQLLCSSFSANLPSIFKHYLVFERYFAIFLRKFKEL